jgi:hypothetical protein
MLEQTNEINLCGVNKNTQRRSSNLEIMFCSFPKEKNHIWANSRKDGLAHSRYNIAFEPNPILVNINKLKPYRYMDQTLKGIKISDN